MLCTAYREHNVKYEKLHYCYRPVASLLVTGGAGFPQVLDLFRV